MKNRVYLGGIDQVSDTCSSIIILRSEAEGCGDEEKYKSRWEIVQDGKVFKYQNCKRERKKKKQLVWGITHTHHFGAIFGGVGKGNFNWGLFRCLIKYDINWLGWFWNWEERDQNDPGLVFVLTIWNLHQKSIWLNKRKKNILWL